MVPINAHYLHFLLKMSEVNNKQINFFIYTRAYVSLEMKPLYTSNVFLIS